MVLLYLRGALTADYPNGVASRVREDFLLHCLAMELASDAQKNSIMLQAAFIPLFTPAKASAEVTRMFNVLTHASMLKGLQANADTGTPKGSVDSMIKLYHALVKSGLIEDTTTHGN